MTTTATSPAREGGAGGPALDSEPPPSATLERIATAIVTVVPFLLLGLAAWQVWNRLLRWPDLVAFGVVYVLTGLGITVGFHRHLTHRSFETSRVLRGVLAALGSAAIEGSVIGWVADHRRHHAFADEEGDPHSPHVGHGGGLRGIARGLVHAHVGWLFSRAEPGAEQRYAPDLVRDPTVSFVNNTFVLWALAGLALPFGLGAVLGGSVHAGLTALLWGGAVRVFVLHHVTYSINSLCHVFGRRPFETDDRSGNLAWLSVPTFGEAWHNNHHAFPTSAVHGLGRRQLDLSAATIRGLERLGLVWNVVRVTPERQRAKAVASTG